MLLRVKFNGDQDLGLATWRSLVIQTSSGLVGGRVETLTEISLSEKRRGKGSTNTGCLSRSFAVRGEEAGQGKG